VTAGDGLRRGDEAVSTEHVSVGLLSLATLILIGMLAVATAATATTAATAMDLWQRCVPRWLTRGASAPASLSSRAVATPRWSPVCSA
jgi:hypothetical protein